MEYRRIDGTHHILGVLVIYSKLYFTFISELLKGRKHIHLECCSNFRVVIGNSSYSNRTFCYRDNCDTADNLDNILILNAECNTRSCWIGLAIVINHIGNEAAYTKIDIGILNCNLCHRLIN